MVGGNNEPAKQVGSGNKSVRHAQSKSLPTLSTMHPKYTEKINNYQSQIKVLLYNYEILEKNQLNFSKDIVALNKQKIEKLLIKLTKKQTKVTEKWMSKVKESPENSGKSSNNSNEDEVLPAKGKGSIAMKDRMAMVRGMRKKKRRNPQHFRNNAKREERANSNAIALGLDVNSELILMPGQCKGDVTEEEVAAAKLTDPMDFDTEYEKLDDAVIAKENTFNAIDFKQFMLNIGLLTQDEYKLVHRQRQDERRVKNHWRNVTYIPEISDRKNRVRYTYLNPELSSPPMLRARQLPNGQSRKQGSIPTQPDLSCS